MLCRLHFEQEMGAAAFEKSYEVLSGCHLPKRASRGPRLPAGMDETTHNSIMKCDLDTHKDFHTNAVLSDGTTMYPGIADSMKKEITGLAPPTMNIKSVKVCPSVVCINRRIDLGLAVHLPCFTSKNMTIWSFIVLEMLLTLKNSISV